MSQGHSLSRPSALINIAAIAVIIASLTAIGAVTGLIPSAHSNKAESPVAPSAAPEALGQSRPIGRPATAASEICRQCGSVEAVRQVQVKGHGSGLGAVAGGAAGAIVGSQFGRGNGRGATGTVDVPWGGFAGPEIERKGSVTTGYRVVVRMQDGSARTVYQPAAPAFAVGDKVRVINGTLAGRG